MKGMPTSCIEYYAKVNNIRVLDLCSQLFDGVALAFGLTNDTNACVVFVRNNKDHTVNYIYEGHKGTTRTCTFVRNEHDKIVISCC